jgi:hypothetical protein
MKYFRLISILLFLSDITYGQTKEISVVDGEIIKMNKVYKCLEYDYHDSLTFFKNHKNGLYTIFDQQGRKIEENSYSSGIVEEKKIIYLYDNSGRNYLWSWYQESSIPKITRTRIEKYDSTGKNIGYCEYSPNHNERCDNYSDNHNVTDTVKTEGNTSKQLLYLTFDNTDRKDTIYKDSYFYYKERLDSIIVLHFKNGKISEKLITKYSYNGSIKSKSEFMRYYAGQLTETKSSTYLENGLLDKTETTSYYFPTKQSKPRIDKYYRKFIYAYWK